MKAAMARVRLVSAVLAGGLIGAAPARADEPTLSMEAAVAVALRRNRDVIAARLEIDSAELDVVAARIYPNPAMQYSVGNLVLGSANPQNPPLTGRPGFWGQPVQSVGVAELIDVWAKRSARTRVAEAGVARRRWQTEDALREIAYAVRSAFADVVREQAERGLAREVAERYAETVRLSRSRFAAGDISEADLRKVELEALKYQNDVIDAEMQLDLARTALAVLLVLPSGRALPPLSPPDEPRPPVDLERLTAQAFERRPDLKAATAGRAVAAAVLTAARREILPDITLGATYTHSAFTVSGDNPNTAALSLSLPVPLFDRNQANVGRARVDIRRADNEVERLRLSIERDVEEAARRDVRSRALLAIFEGAGEARDGMLERADGALRVAERSYKAGAISLLELLEAQRTYLDTRGRYLRVVYESRQATIDIIHATGGPIQ